MDNELEQDIRLSDERTFESRVRRYKFFFTLPEPRNGLWLDPPECSTLIEEAFWCYIEGHFFACVLLCQMTLESLFRALVSVGDRASFYDIIEEARSQELIDDEQRSNLHKLRTLRNQFTHLKPSTHPQSLWRLRVRKGKGEEEQADDAAQLALRVMFGILAKSPFAL